MKFVSRSRSALIGTISSQLYLIITMLVSLISTPLMIRYLDKESYGLSIIFFQIIGYLALFDFGFGTAVVRELALNRSDDEHNQLIINRIMSTSVIVFGSLGIMLAVIGFFSAPFIPAIYALRPDLASVAVPIVFTLSLAMGAQFLQRALGGLFYAHHRQFQMGTAFFVVNMASIFMTLVLLSYGVGLWSFVYANFFQVFVYLGVQIVLIRQYYPKLIFSKNNFDKQLLQSMFSQGKFMFLHGLASQIILNTDRLVIGKVVSLTAVAVFSITIRIPEVGMTLLSRISENVTPAIMEIVAHETTDRAREQYRRIMLLTTALAMVAFWLILTFNKWFINLWVGLTFFAGTLVLGLALLLMIQQTIVRAMSFFLYANGTSKQLSYMSIIEAFANISLSVFLGHRIGLPGILAGTLIASSLTSSWYTPYLLLRHLGIPFRDTWQAMLVPAVGISVVGGVVYLLVHWLTSYFSQTILLFGLSSVAAGVLLAGFTWLIFLRRSFGIYVPERLRPYLFLS